MKKLDSLSFIVPVYNEEKNIGTLLAHSLRILPQCASMFEIIIVDDGSADNSFEIANSFVNKEGIIKAIRHSTNLGSGAAMWTGFSNAKYHYIFYTDADGQFDISDLKLLIAFIQDYDIVLGYRIGRRDNLFRKVDSRLWNLIINAMFGLNVRDINCAFKLFDRKVISSISVRSKGAFTNAEILVKAKKYSYKWVEVGVSHYPRTYGTQSGGRLRVMLKGFYELVRFYFKLRIN